jgi:uncharacterized FAD-dependent dehydrogenase
VNQKFAYTTISARHADLKAGGIILREFVNVQVGLDELDLVQVAARVTGDSPEDIVRVDVLRRSLDSRGKRPRWVLKLRVLYAGDTPPPVEHRADFESPDVVDRDQRVIIVGTGPAGLFAALRFADAGVPVTVLERGGALGKRHKRARLLRGQRELDPESNLCFGEGGAGTYSDGKLYTRKKTKRVREVYERLVAFGADPQILVDAHPHVGTNRLIPVLRNLRDHLLERGVTMLFDTRVDDLRLDGDRVCGVETSAGPMDADAVIFATGHSARDTYAMLARRGVRLETKPFAVGARVEHHQDLIDHIQFGRAAGHPELGAAEYFLRCQVGERGVYSFCMCPGGFVIPTPTEVGHLNVNGMSNAARKNRFANAALVVTLTPEDFAPSGDALEGLEYQREIERRAFEVGGSDYSAPATRLDDMFRGRASTTLPGRSSYRPSLTPSDIGEVLPRPVTAAIREALGTFDRQLRGYLTNEAVIIAAETTTSSPIRVPRGDNLQSVTLRGLYPTGEGAGYSGGIVSSAIDGMRVAEQVLGTRPER